MPSPLEAWKAAAKAAAAAGVEVAELTTMAEHRAAAELFTAAFGAPAGHAPLPATVLRAFALTDCYVAGARRHGEMVGACAGFRTAEGLFSQTTGVLAGARSCGIGFALKQHQRAWALARGIATVSWTFDPLVRRNAHFNIAKLGAVAARYLPDFYGAMTDALNAGDRSDRCLVRWDLAGPAAVAAAAGTPPRPDVAALRATGVPVILDVDGYGAPRPGPPASGGTRLCRIPPDAIRLRTDDLPLALRWRHALRRALSGALAEGLVAAAIDDDGWYVLARPEPDGVVPAWTSARREDR